jgi:hypothetical protein
MRRGLQCAKAERGGHGCRRKPALAAAAGPTGLQDAGQRRSHQRSSSNVE